ncbi:hypothetical protein Q1695_000045 [Nippostrongylus brasiliensis]|nr:hypothetical protein Q1695_000045 [Nippostrongylus brasiliensis]
MNLIIATLALIIPTTLGEYRSQTFDLPSLLIHTDQIYLLRKLPTNLSCQLSPGWSEAKFDSVRWMKDGKSLDEVIAKEDKKDYLVDGPFLTLLGGKQQLEGDYQCLAEVSGVRLSNRQVVKTTLVSDPIKLRRARITKFDQTTNHYVHVKQGQVARLPCAGLPDVVPGPAEICFVKSDSDSDGCLSDKVDSNYLSTATGMQISVVQPYHAGEYYCVVRNEYTKQTRKSPRYVKLRVDPADNSTFSWQPEPPQLVFPSKENRLESPIPVDVVVGQDIILECVFVDAKVVWTKHGEVTPQISLTDDEARLRQVWGNLRIRQVNQGDSGIYSCHGLSPFDDSPSLQEDDHPKVYYQLFVHSPTDVHLEMNQNVRDKSWQLSCLAKNVQYEIPMVHVNGTALIDAISQMGTASSTNFYSNPINATIRIKSNYSGSVQCISRPAMDEAEIYGPGLERGRSHNLYVVSSPSRDHLIKQGPVNVTATIGEDVELICLVIQRVNSKYWLKDGSYVPFGAARTQRVGSNSLKIQKVEKKDEGWYTCVVVGEGSEKSEQQAYLRVNFRTTTSPATATTEPYLVKKKDDYVTMEDVCGFVTASHVRIQWSVIGKMEALSSIVGFKIELRTEGSANDSWIDVDSVDSHVRATTIKDLVPNNRYQFRVKLVKDDGSIVESSATTWMAVDMPTEDVLPAAPIITSASLLSSSSAKLIWSHEAATANAKAREFIVKYSILHSKDSQSEQFRVNNTEVIVDNLLENETYTFFVMAENHAGRSTSSGVMLNTTMFNGADTGLSFFYRTLGNGFTIQGVVLITIGFSLVLFVLLICCVVCCSIGVQCKNNYFKSANGKFLDTSYRIFNEQKVHKSRFGDHPMAISAVEDLDETSPLRASEESAADFPRRFHFSNALPNLYGEESNTNDDDRSTMQHDSPYVASSMPIDGSSFGRTHSPCGVLSHEMLLPYGVDAIFSSAPHMNTSQRLVCSEALEPHVFSTAETASSLTDTTSTGLNITRLGCESPLTLPMCVSEAGGPRCGEMSRSSYVSSTDVLPNVTMQTFKTSCTVFHATETNDRGVGDICGT